MSFFNKIVQWVNDPNRFFSGLLLELSPVMPDKLYLSCMVRARCGYWPNWNNPHTFSEKLQWLKLYNKKQEYTTMVDKFAVKDYVAKKIGEEYIIPTLGVWNKPGDIDWDSLPDRFVLKTTHGGGSCGVVVCKDKASFDRHKAIEKLKKGMKQNIYTKIREWPYKNVPHRIIAEQYIEPGPKIKDLPDYKWYCFNGEPKFCQIIQDRSTKETIDFFDVNWNHQDFIGFLSFYADFKNAEIEPTMPASLELQIKIAKKLSVNIPFVRIDLYEVNGKVFFGEMTLYPASGLGSFRPDEYNYKLGELLKLPKL